MEHEYRDVQFMSAAEKSSTLRTWVRFLAHGLKFEHFTNGLYNHLIQHCSFIAHYNRAGFYSHYFERGDSIALFLSQFDSRSPCLSVEYGASYWLRGDYEDINLAMIAEGSAFIPLLLEEAHRNQKASDVAAANALLARHGMSTQAFNEMDPPSGSTSAPPEGVLPYAS